MNRFCIVCRGTILLVAFGLTAAFAQTPPPPQPALVCGLEVYPSPIGFPEAEPEVLANQALVADLSGDPCEDGTTVFAAQFERATETPVQEIAPFDLDADAQICIISQSGGKGKASLFVDGEIIAEPEDFDDGLVIYTDSLVAGSHGLGVRAVGKPGGYLDIEIRQLGSGGGGGDPDVPAPGEVRIDSESGAVDMVNADGSVRLQNVITDHPLLTPNGDGHNDTTVIQALVTPLVTLPGKDDGTVNYFVDWDFQVVDLATCNTIDASLSGSTQINSPTLITTTFDGRDTLGEPLPPGNFAYKVDGTVVDQFGLEFGSIESPAFGLLIDDPLGLVEYDELAEQLGTCNEGADPSACRCPGVDGQLGVPDPNCGFSFVRKLLPEGNFPDTVTPNYDNPSAVDTSFITSTLNPVTGRYTVTVDLRDQNAMGLAPKGSGRFSSEASLRQWVSDMTGVPVSTGEGLFNFDYVQIGNSTAVNLFGRVPVTFNHFLLDAMTNNTGRILIGSVMTDLGGGFNDDVGAPEQYVVAGREGDECSNSANSDGANNMHAKFCAYNMAVKIGNVTDLGVYMLRTTTFGLDYNDALTSQDTLCVLTDVMFNCGVRTKAVTADELEIESSYYVDTDSGPIFTRSDTTQVTDATGVSVAVDRANGEDGVCSRSITIRDGLAVRIDAADGVVPESCIINGIF